MVVVVVTGDGSGHVVAVDTGDGRRHRCWTTLEMVAGGLSLLSALVATSTMLMVGSLLLSGGHQHWWWGWQGSSEVVNTITILLENVGSAIC